MAFVPKFPMTKYSDAKIYEDDNGAMNVMARPLMNDGTPCEAINWRPIVMFAMKLEPNLNLNPVEYDHNREDYELILKWYRDDPEMVQRRAAR